MRSTAFGGLVMIAAILVLPATVHAQEATLTGTVADSTGGVNLAFAPRMLQLGFRATF